LRLMIERIDYLGGDGSADGKLAILIRTDGLQRLMEELVDNSLREVAGGSL